MRLGLALAATAALWAGHASGQSFLITSVSNTGILGDAQMSPGSAINVYGSFPGKAGRDYSYSVGGGKTLIGVTVIIDVKAGTIRLQLALPEDAPVGSTTLTVFYLGSASNAFPLSLTAYAPEFGGLPYHLSGTQVFPSSPAYPGEPLRVYVNGLGLLPQTPTLTIGGKSAMVVSATLPGGGGEAELDIFVPSDAPLGLVPCIVTMGSVSTAPMTVAVGTEPVISAIVSTASYASNGTAAPGSMVSIFGVDFGTTDSAGTFPSTTVNGNSVLFGATAAPIFSLTGSQGQINVLVPTELDTAGNVQVTVKGPSGTSQPVLLNLLPAAPGVFFYSDPSNPARRNAVALLANTAWFAMPTSMAAAMGLPSSCGKLSVLTLCGQPIHPGDYLQIYVTGLGAATPRGAPGGSLLATGAVAPVSGDPLYLTVATPTVTVGGQPAAVLFSGIAPGYAGLYQLDVQLPANTPAGDDVVLSVSMPGGGADAGTTIAVAKP